VSILRAQIAQADAELRLIDEQIERAKLRTPFDGIVVHGDLTQSLGAPVERGEVLFEVAPLDDYRVVLEVNEHDIGVVKVGQTGRLLLTGMPDKPFDLVLDRIMPVAVTKDGRNFFRVEAHVKTLAPELRPGMQGIAKVKIGERKLLWIWSHTLLDRLRLKVWSAGL
jgi:multidrug resistance efflux pump